MKLLLVLFIATLLSACTQMESIQRNVTSQEESIAEEIIFMLQQKKVKNLERFLEKSLKTENNYKQLEKIASVLPSESPEKVMLVGAGVRQRLMGNINLLVYEYSYMKQWYLIEIYLMQHYGKDDFELVNINANQLPDSFAATFGFNFRNAGILHYGLLIGAVLSLLIMFYSFLLCVFSPVKIKQKWKWMLLSLLGVSGLSMNWTTGEVASQAFIVNLLSFGLNKTASGPFIFNVFFPIPALLIIAFRNKVIIGKSKDICE